VYNKTKVNAFDKFSDLHHQLLMLLTSLMIILSLARDAANMLKAVTPGII